MSPMHWAIVLGVLLLLFGAKKLPDMARSVGQSARVLKGELKGLEKDSADTTDSAGEGAGPVAHQLSSDARSGSRPNSQAS